MDKILLLDLDGPVSNSRTWKMPGCVDPVAIQLLNDATKAGWKTVLTSTIRKHFDRVEQATEFMNRVDFNVEWFWEWRTSPNFTAQRHLEVLQWMSNTDVEDEAVILVVDDERFPHEILEKGGMVQLYAISHAGLDYHSISEAYRIFEMDDTQLAERSASTIKADQAFNLKGTNMDRYETEFDNLLTKLCGGDNDLPRVIDLTGIDRDNIVLDKYLRISDLVVMHMDKESRGWGRKDVPDGTIGIVVGFHRYEVYRARINNYGHTPGKYMANGAAMVRWFDGSVSSPGAGDLRWLHNHDKKQQERRNDRLYNEAFSYEAKVDDLPNLPLWEMDIVKFRPKNGKQPWRHTTRGRVVSIDYHNLNTKRSDGSPMPVYNCTPLEEGWGNCSFEEPELQLVERGNLWKWFNGQRDQIQFASLEEELSFHSALGLEEQVRCEQSGDYRWPLSAILPALKAGIIDVVRHSSGFFGGAGQVSAYKMTDPDLAARVRQRSLNGYDPEQNPTQTRIVGPEWNSEAQLTVARHCLEYQVPLVNLKAQDGYADASALEALNIQVVPFDPDEPQTALPKGYVFFSPDGDSHTLHYKHSAEVRVPEADSLRRRERLRVRILSDAGWNEASRSIVIAACKTLDSVFVDRAAVSDAAMNEAGIQNQQLAEGEKVPFDLDLWGGYVFFTHRGMKDLPYDVTINLN